MCGIAGFIHLNHNLNFNNIHKSILETIKHRGPNNSGIWNNNYISLVHSRLSILDTSLNAHQPMISKNKRFVISYNGEIYNYFEIKNKILNDITFKSSGDTEVILEYFNKIGINSDSISKLNGMFAIAIYDTQEKQLYLIRDKIGQKPLYFYFDEKRFSFSSDLKTFYLFKDYNLNLNHSNFQDYLELGYFPQSTTPISKVHKLLPATYMQIDLNGRSPKFQIKKWWDETSLTRKTTFKDSNSLSELHKLFIDVTKDNIISDVDLGIFLSSGVDSSLIAHYSQIHLKKNLNTFTIGFDSKNYDESKYAENIARNLGSNHETYNIHENDIKDTMLNINNIFSEPFADSSQIPTFLLSKNSSKKIKVALSGDGGDELFGGYNRYRYLKLIKTLINLNLLKKIKPSKFLKFSFINKNIQLYDEKILKLQSLEDFDKDNSELEIYKLMLKNHYYSDSVNTLLLKNNIEKNNPQDDDLWNSNIYFENKMMISDLLNYLPDDILVKSDRASMHVGLEIRSPFLDDRIIKFSQNLPKNSKISLFNNKIILRKLLSKYFKFKPSFSKKGFAIPFSNYLKNDLFDHYNCSLLNYDKLINQSIFNANSVNRLLREFKSNKFNHSKILWNIIVLQGFIDFHEKNSH